MDIRFTLQAEYSSTTYSVTAFNLYGYTSGSASSNLLASNITKSQLLAGYIVTTNLIIVSGYIQPMGACGAAPPQTYSLVFSEGPIFVGNFSSYSGKSSSGIVKLNNNLTLDTTFDVGSGFGFYVGGGPYQIVRQSSGKIVVAGSFFSYDGYSSTSLITSQIIRLNPDGSRDYTFSGVTSLFQGRILSIDTQPDGKILIGGYKVNITDITNNSGLLVRLNIDGSYDTEFNNNVPLISGTVRIVLCLPNDNQSILAAGNFPSSLLKLTNLGMNVSIPPPALQQTSNGLGLISCMVLDSQSRIMIGGAWPQWSYQNYRNPIRINAAGTLDFNWLPRCTMADGGPAEVTSIVEQPGTLGKVIIAGDFTRINNTIARTGIARVLVNGLYDSTWVPVATYWSPFGFLPGPKLSILSNGNILFYGNIDTVNNLPINNIVVLSPTNGAPVTSGITYGVSETAAYRDVVSF